MGAGDVTDIVSQISHMKAAANRSKDLRVDVRASILTTAANPFNTDLSQTGEFLLTPEINFNDHLYVALIQSHFDNQHLSHIGHHWSNVL